MCRHFKAIGLVYFLCLCTLSNQITLSDFTNYSSKIGQTTPSCFLCLQISSELRMERK